MSLEGQHLGRYQLLRLLGSGGMGEVYLAEDARIAQQVAIKVIRTEVTPYPDANTAKEAARLFEREAKAIARLDHPNILPLYAYGEETIHGQQLTYLVMPYRREGTLASWLRQRSTTEWLSAADVAHLLTQAAEALQHAHDQQILHQDIKPSNFLIRARKDQPSRPDLLLADFGIAKFTTATASASQSIRGTPTYMAPEQWDGQPVAATDQYALAIMAYELLTGRPPFSGNLGQIMRQHFQATPQPPSTLNPALSPALDAVLLRALAKQPEERFPSVSDFAQAFQQAVQEGMREAEAPTLRATTPPPASGADIRATLAISGTEAQRGTTRTLTLPGGRQVRVSVPAGAHDGQVVRLEGQGEVSPSGGPAGALILTLLVKAAEEAPSFPTPSATAAEETVRTATPEAAAPSTPTTSTTGPQATASLPARPESSTPPSPDVSPTEVATAARQGLLPPAPIPLSVGTPLYTYRGHSHSVDAVAWSPDGKRIASGSHDNTVQVWDATDGSHVFTYRGHSHPVFAVAWSPDGKRIASGSWDKTVQVWDVADGSNVYTYRGHSNAQYGEVTAVVWSPDGKRAASGSGDKTVQVWDAADGGNVFIYHGHSGPLDAVEWSPDGKRIASGSDDYTVQVWDAADGSHVYTYRGHSYGVYAVAWSPDGKRIASGSHDNTVQVWDATDGGNVYTYRGHSDYVHAVAWSPDGKRIASASDDKTVQVWDAADGGNVYTYRGHSNAVSGVYAVAWSPDGKRIASGSWDKTVQVWDAAE